MKNQVIMTLPKETNRALITDSKEMKINELSDRELGIILFKMLSELQEHRQIRKMTNRNQEKNPQNPSAKKNTITDLRIQ